MASGPSAASSLDLNPSNWPPPQSPRQRLRASRIYRISRRCLRIVGRATCPPRKPSLNHAPPARFAASKSSIWMRRARRLRWSWRKALTYPALFIRFLQRRKPLPSTQGFFMRFTTANRSNSYISSFNFRRGLPGVLRGLCWSGYLGEAASFNYGKRFDGSFETAFRAAFPFAGRRYPSASGATGRLGARDSPARPAADSAPSEFYIRCGKRMLLFWNSPGIFGGVDCRFRRFTPRI